MCCLGMSKFAWILLNLRGSLGRVVLPMNLWPIGGVAKTWCLLWYFNHQCRAIFRPRRQGRQEASLEGGNICKILWEILKSTWNLPNICQIYTIVKLSDSIMTSCTFFVCQEPPSNSVTSIQAIAILWSDSWDIASPKSPGIDLSKDTSDSQDGSEEAEEFFGLQLVQGSLKCDVSLCWSNADKPRLYVNSG